MDNGTQIQQTNLVDDNIAAAVDEADSPAQASNEPISTQIQSDTIPAGSAADPTAPATPVIDNSPATNTTAPSASPSAGVVSNQPSEPADTKNTNLDQLEDIKRSALDELKPLIEHVEQSPEERFETVMMMIRSNDDAKLIPSAYEAAKGIKDEKMRASALLNIVSEIEYLKSKSQ